MPSESVARECGLDPERLAEADARLGAPYAIVRYGKLCHEYHPDGEDEPGEVFSATKTLAGVVTGVGAWQTRDLERRGRKTGPITANDRVDHWLDDFSFNPDAKIEHVLGMVGFNDDLNYPNRNFVYDAAGTREINRLSDMLNIAIAQDPERLGENLDEFTHTFLFEPLGMRDSTWSNGAADKIMAFSWVSTLRDMARLGLLILNGGEWNGERILGEDWIYRLTHPSFEDANQSYGYLTWLSSPVNLGLFGRCAPSALWREYPHGETSGAPDCNYPEGLSCSQELDGGPWAAMGLFGQYISGYPDLDLIIVGKDMGDTVLPRGMWNAIRPALVALDPNYAGDEEAFCADYAAGRYGLAPTR